MIKIEVEVSESELESLESYKSMLDGSYLEDDSYDLREVLKRMLNYTKKKGGE